MNNTILSKTLFPIFIATFLFVSCTKEEITPTPDTIPNTTSDSMSYTFLALGDSYTIGQGVPPEDSWPFQLKTRLENNDLGKISVDVIAQTGWTTTNLIDNIATAQPEVHDLVSLLIGVNDQYQGRPFSVFKTGFDTLLQTAILLAGSKDNVMVVSIPDYGVTPFGSSNSDTIAEELDAYNSYMEAQCLDRTIPFINITEISRDLGSGNMALASDNLHPSAFQYGEWVSEMLPVAISILED